MMKFFSFVCFALALLTLTLSTTLSAQDADRVRTMIQQFKENHRGPYQAIRWFCPDGTVLPPKERCATPGGIQHALYRNDVQKLMDSQHLFLGQILAGTAKENFWDATNQNSRAIQYQLENYLYAADDGWILRRARFYRGAKQAEDESAWGQEFLTWLFGQTELLQSQFFLLRQLTGDIPFEADRSGADRWQRIRLLSKDIAEVFPSFMNIRIKIHGQPTEADLEATREFRQQNREKLLPDVDALLQSLIMEMEIAYAPIESADLRKLIKTTNNATLSEQMESLIKTFSATDGREKREVAICEEIALLLWSIRLELPNVTSSERLHLMALSLRLERMLFRFTALWRPVTMHELVAKAMVLTRAAAGCGYIEIWEWNELKKQLEVSDKSKTISLAELMGKTESVRQVVNWGTGTMHAVYDNELKRFLQFEPLVYGFLDDRVRSSVLLPLGDVAGEMAEHVSRLSGISNQVSGLPRQNQIRGINPGFALGQLEVLEEVPEGFVFSDKKIYALLYPPAELKPVAGIITVSAGNLVSHIQLLARNLGIPNAIVSQQVLQDLKAFSDKNIFYAVSPLGRVVLKLSSEMTQLENALVVEKKRSDERIFVPLENLQLERRDFVSLRNLRAGDSGRICGPKAANLGELKNLFPDRVVEGFVIPFGEFRRHMDQPMPGESGSYWAFLEQAFQQAAKKSAAGSSAEDVDAFVLEKLAKLRKAILTMPFLSDFEERMQAAFKNTLMADLGKKAVFIRSDTNMEDLAEFTGAGLNLTVFNVAAKDDVLQGVRSVWASPYNERSYSWRQKYLLNPESVYPSILVLPTVPVDKSGVLITTGVSSGDANDLTVAFSRGPGGAVDGQAAETYLLKPDDKNLLLSPSRERRYNILPASGGRQNGYADFNRRVLNPAELKQLRSISTEIYSKLASAHDGAGSKGPYDVELGFLGPQLMLFQIRPFVENKLAQSNSYLMEMDSGINFKKKIDMKKTLPNGEIR